MANAADGRPTKEFFVKMLTRDISLDDAILDLLDNCLDGVLRLKKKDSSSDFYSGYEVQITVTNESFTIMDNCGGIPRDIAENEAFRMGRPSNATVEDKPSVGIYGIGMKRAIFKIGQQAAIITHNQGKAYCVQVPSNWVTADSWDFPIKDVADADVPEYILGGGTYIKIEQLNEEVVGLWRTIDSYTSGLISAIQQSYSLIIEKGFSVHVNGKKVVANQVQLLSSRAQGGIKPFVYRNSFDSVKVSLAIGLYKPIPSDEEIDDYNDARRSSADAGWTIVCNDRVVLYNDKTFVSGWGEAGVPQYHTQFIGIKGIVFFESNDPSKLPLTTTKRGIDLSSPVYAAVKEEMRKGLRLFTGYTNKWKGRLEQERGFSRDTEAFPVVNLIDDVRIQEELGIELTPKKGGSSEFFPILPKPVKETDYVNVRYSRPREEVEFLSQQLFSDGLDEIGASAVGDKCFELVYERRKGYSE